VYAYLFMYIRTPTNRCTAWRRRIWSTWSLPSRMLAALPSEAAVSCFCDMTHSNLQLESYVRVTRRISFFMWNLGAVVIHLCGVMHSYGRCICLQSWLCSMYVTVCVYAHAYACAWTHCVCVSGGGEASAWCNNKQWWDWKVFEGLSVSISLPFSWDFLRSSSYLHTIQKWSLISILVGAGVPKPTREKILGCCTYS